jgi:hypothetical protein
MEENKIKDLWMGFKKMNYEKYPINKKQLTPNGINK